MNNKIRVEFYQHNNFICGRVLEMPEEIRGTGILIEKDNIRLVSDSFPDLYIDEHIEALYLRGANEVLDNKWFGKEFTSEKEASDKIKIYQKLIDEYNDKFIMG